MRSPAWRDEGRRRPRPAPRPGRKHAELKQFDEAKKDLSAPSSSPPTARSTRSLAACYEAKGDLDRWKATLDEYLAKTEDAGLEHAKVRVQLANYLMSRGRFAEAKPYAEAAAETWAGWAMTCAAKCDEGLDDWERAELWTRRTTERYPGSSWSDWYLFCKRTGHGDVEAARAFADAYLAAVEDRPDLPEPKQLGFFFWSAGKTKKALEYLEKAYAESPAFVEGIALILLADELGDAPRRGKMLDDFCNRFAAKWPRVVAIARLFRDANGDAKRRSTSRPSRDSSTGCPPASRGNTEFLVGKYLLNRGQRESSRHAPPASRRRTRDAGLAPADRHGLAAVVGCQEGPLRPGPPGECRNRGAFSGLSLHESVSVPDLGPPDDRAGERCGRRTGPGVGFPDHLLLVSSLPQSEAGPFSDGAWRSGLMVREHRHAIPNRSRSSSRVVAICQGHRQSLV